MPVDTSQHTGRVSWSEQARVYARALVGSRADPGRFVVFGQGRSGSSLLLDLLNSCPQVHCDEEIYYSRVRAPGLWATGLRRRHPGRVYGFKAKIYQLTEVQGLDPAQVLRGWHRDGWQLIHLQRTDSLRHTLSSMVASVRSSYQYVGEAPPKAAIEVPPDLLLQGIEGRQALLVQERELLAELPHEVVVYETDLADPAAHQPTLDRLTAYLGLPSAQARTDRKRINAGPLRALITNYDEVAAALAATPWSHWLD